MKFLLYFLVLFFSLSYPKAKDIPDSISHTRLGIVSGLTVGGFVTSTAFQYDKYWSDPSKFHIMNLETEYEDALLADKLGHLYFSYALAKTYAKVLEWTGMNETDRLWLAGGVSLFHQTYVEINDGFSDGKPYLGFSFGDMATNILGAGIPLLQYYYPQLDNLSLKISYIKADNFSYNDHASVFDDYESTYHWLSFDILGSLGIDEGIFPNIFQPAIGHSVSNINRFGEGHHELYLSIDINWKYLYKYEFVQNSYYLQLLIEFLDKYKFPMPTLKFSPVGGEFIIR